MRRRRCLAPVLVRVALAGLAVLAAPAPGAAALSEADRLWLVGVGAFDDGLYETAYRELGRFVQAAPTDRRRGDAALLRGKAAFSMERYAEALTEFDAAETLPLTAATTPGEAIFWQGEALFRLRRWEEARDRYARFLGPQARVALRAGGPLRARPGRARDGARRQRRRHVPGLPPRLSQPLAGADGRLQRGAGADPGQALGGRPRPPRARTRSRYPGSPYLAETRYLLGVAQMEAGRPEGARTLEQFVAQSPSSELAPPGPRARRRGPDEGGPEPRRRWSSTRLSSGRRPPTRSRPRRSTGSASSRFG